MISTPEGNTGEMLGHWPPTSRVLTNKFLPRSALGAAACGDRDVMGTNDDSKKWSSWFPNDRGGGPGLVLRRSGEGGGQAGHKRLKDEEPF